MDDFLAGRAENDSDTDIFGAQRFFDADAEASRDRDLALVAGAFALHFLAHLLIDCPGGALFIMSVDIERDYPTTAPPLPPLPPPIAPPPLPPPLAPPPLIHVALPRG